MPIPSATNFVLASGSPRRRQLLDEAGYEFRVVAPRDSAECGICSGETPVQLVARLARQKAADVADQLTDSSASSQDDLLLGCDTVGECLGQVLGKPHDIDHAREMLRLIRGRTHRVLSGVCLQNISGSRCLVRVAVTTLFMEPITDEQLEGYLNTDDWEGKAGAFGYQDGHDWLRIIEGSESNVVGLPMELLAEMLEEIDP